MFGHNFPLRENLKTIVVGQQQLAGNVGWKLLTGLKMQPGRRKRDCGGAVVDGVAFLPKRGSSVNYLVLVFIVNSNSLLKNIN
jgi:hypothetical protein